MNLEARMRTAPIVHAHLSVIDEPAFGRVIALPVGAPDDWLVDAYLLALGRESRVDEEEGRSEADDEEWDERERGGWRCGGWGDRRLPIRALGREVQVKYGSRFAPAMGHPLVEVLEEGAGGDATEPAWWGEVHAPPRLAQLNAYLVELYGVATPSFEERAILDGGLGLDRESRLVRLLRELDPRRRLALCAHLDQSLVPVKPVPLEVVETAIAPVRSLMLRLGSTGCPQDEATGWMPSREIDAVVRDLDWQENSVSASSVGAPAAVISSFARDSKLARRWRGRVLPAPLGRELMEPDSQTMRTLAKAVVESGDRYGSGWSRGSADATLALLAVADGSARTLDDVEGIVRRGRSAMIAARNERPRERVGYADPGELWSWDWGTGRHRVAEEGLGAQERRMLERLAAVSEAGRFGEVGPSMRAVAKAALM